VAVALFAGASAIGISLLQGMERGQASGLRKTTQLVSETGELSATAELVENQAPDRRPAPGRSNVAAPMAAPAKPAAPQSIQPPPPEALPATSVRAVGSVGGTTKPSSSVNQTNEPFSVSLVVADGAGLTPLAQDVARRLKDDGFNVKVSSLDDAGRPDVLLLLGQNGEKNPAGWFCEPGLPAGATLSRLVLDELSSLPPDSGGISSSAVGGPTSNFPCEAIGIGRARVAASLVELPAGVVKRPDQVSVAAEGMTSGIERYFDQNGLSVRNTRASNRVVWPATGRISSYFGPAHPLGIDIAQFDGPITAATEGTVAFAGGDECCSYGLYVVLDSPNGIRTVYAHLDKITVKRGQKVRQGQTLGEVGCTGHCTGPHLHFEVIERGARQDPLRYLP